MLSKMSFYTILYVLEARFFETQTITQLNLAIYIDEIKECLLIAYSMKERRIENKKKKKEFRRKERTEW